MKCLANFIAEMHIEIDRADRKHGNWDNLSNIEAAEKILDEVKEVHEAALADDIHSDHGLLRESVQTAVTAFKMYRKNY